MSNPWKEEEGEEEEEDKEKEEEEEGDRRGKGQLTESDPSQGKAETEVLHYALKAVLKISGHVRVKLWRDCG